MQQNQIFNPLDKVNLGKSVSAEILSQPVINLCNLKNFSGAGIYAIYYKGDFPLYRNISAANSLSFCQPIYAGKAVPKGARKGISVMDSAAGNALYNRLTEHKQSIISAENLKIEDFYYRYLLVDDIWIPLGESVLIQQTRPIWNIVIDGFGNHEPGKGRDNQKRSPWDMLHPGRDWASKLPKGISVNEIEQSVKKFYEN